MHYPAIYEIVDDVCDELGVERRKSSTLWGAIRSHLAYLKALGQPGSPGVAAVGAKSQPAPALPVA